MIWFENIVTGQQWAVSHAGLIDRLTKDTDYKVIEDPTRKPESKSKAAKTMKTKAGKASAE